MPSSLHNSLPLPRSSFFIRYQRGLADEISCVGVAAFLFPWHIPAFCHHHTRPPTNALPLTPLIKQVRYSALPLSHPSPTIHPNKVSEISRVLVRSPPPADCPSSPPLFNL